jgi:hypothetical protein
MLPSKCFRYYIGKVVPDQSLANRSEVKSAGKPGNGSPKPDGTRLQAVKLSPEILHIVVLDSAREIERESRRCTDNGRQQF